jgi:hypothetical protein
MRRITVLLAMVFIASCAQVPKEASYPMTHQEKMQASEHWRFLAKDISSKMKSTICPDVIENTAAGAPNLSPELTYKSPIQRFQSSCQVKDAFFISDADQSPFGKAMRTFLTTELASQGFTIGSNSKCPYELSWDVQRVFYQAERVSGYSGIFVGLGEVVQFLVAGGMDNKYWTKPHSEIIITYELIKKEQKTKSDILRGTHIYYVNDADRDHYWDISRNEVSETSLRPINYFVTNR